MDMDLMSLLYKVNTVLQVMLEQVKVIPHDGYCYGILLVLLIRETNIMVKITGYGKFFFKPMRLFGKELRLIMIIGLHGNE